MLRRASAGEHRVQHVNLREILGLCQYNHIDEWRSLPGGGLVNKLITG